MIFPLNNTPPGFCSHMARQCRSRNKSVTGENGTKAQKSLKHDTSIIREISKKINMTKESIIGKN